MLPLLDATELQRRSPVWEAFSDLFLDTDPALHYDGIVRTLRASPYTREQLWHILAFEVTPAFRFNLSLVTGEWAGWEAAYVRRRVLATRRHRHWLQRLGFCRSSSVDNYVHEQWRLILERWDTRP